MIYLSRLKFVLLSCCSFLLASFANADYRDDIGYTKLQNELGVGTPTGIGVKVTQVESDSGGSLIYLPNPTQAQFSGKTIVDKSGLATGVYSSHATGVGILFYGNTSSLAPGITRVDAYQADNWLGAGYLRGKNGSFKPLVSSSRVANHSWIGSTENLTNDLNILRRVDWVVNTDEFIQVVGVGNGLGTNDPLLSSAYNVITVGRTDGLHRTGTPSLDAVYISGRTRPDIVAPMSTTSEATPVIASAAALLVETGHNNPGLSTDPSVTSTVSRNGDVIYNAERSEVVKAVLMAGADRQKNNVSGADITDYRAAAENQTSNGLDKRFGAGQLDVYNSLQILAGGEQNSLEDGGSGSIGMRGFDYDPLFGGASGSNSTATYNFSTTTEPGMLTASLVWNMAIDGGNGPKFSGSAKLYNLDLLLYDVTGGQSLITGSIGQTENSENIWTTLAPDRNYSLQVIAGGAQSPFLWDYAVAWQMTSVPLPGTLPLFLSGLAGMLYAVRSRKKDSLKTV